MRSHLSVLALLAVSIAGCGGEPEGERGAEPPPASVPSRSLPTMTYVEHWGEIACVEGQPPPTNGGCVDGRDLVDDPNATWTLEAGARLGPGTRRVTALVMERACASGAPIDDRLLPTEIVYGLTTVTVTFHVKHLPQYEADGSAITETCQAVMTALPIELREPLGERALADGFFDPPHPVLPAAGG
jgi:hypothetical protein